MRGSLFSETQFIFFQILIHSTSKAWDKGEWCEGLSSPLMYLTASKSAKYSSLQEAFKYIGKILTHYKNGLNNDIHNDWALHLVQICIQKATGCIGCIGCIGLVRVIRIAPGKKTLLGQVVLTFGETGIVRNNNGHVDGSQKNQNVPKCFKCTVMRNHPSWLFGSFCFVFWEGLDVGGRRA